MQPFDSESAPTTEYGAVSSTNIRTARLQWLAWTIGMLLVYGVMAYFYSTRPLYGPRVNREILDWAVTALLLYGYWMGYRLLQKVDIPLMWIVLSGVAMALMAVCIPPFHSTDLFGYINRGWEQLHYHLNPYVYTIDQIPRWTDDAMITNHWVNNPSPYGFLYMIIAKGLCALGQGNKTLTVTIFKFGNVLLHGLTALLIYGALKSKIPPSQPPPAGGRSPYTPSDLNVSAALFLYLWNPLILVHGLANGHNDLWMAFFLMIGAYAAMAGAWIWILPALMAATLIKYAAVVVFPITILFLVRQKAWKSLGIGLILAGLVLGISAAPYIGDWRHFQFGQIDHNAFVSHGSLHSLVYSSFKLITEHVAPMWYAKQEMVRTILKNILLLAYALFYAGLLIWRFREKEDYSLQGWLQDAVLTLLLLIALVSLKFYPWYLGMFFPLGLLLPIGHWLRRLLILLTGGQLLSLTGIGQAHVLNFLLMTALPTCWLWLCIRAETKNKHLE